MQKDKTVRVYCVNNQQSYEVAMGSSLAELYTKIAPKGMDLPLGAKVNNVVEGLDYVVFNNKDIEFLDLRDYDGKHIYSHSLCLLLNKCVKDLYGSCGQVKCELSISNGLFFHLYNIGRELTEETIKEIEEKMREVCKRDIPFVKVTVHTETAIELFQAKGYKSKVKLLKSSQKLYTTYYTLEGEPDYYYSPLVTSTGLISEFGLIKYSDGLLLRFPDPENPGKLMPLINQDKMLKVMEEHKKWQEIIGIDSIGDLNEYSTDKHLCNETINISEALQEKKIAAIAEEIKLHPSIKLILIAGPSSSGKTTFSKRLSVQLMATGIRPVAISMDDYFVDRDNTPRDEKGDYDFESVYALNIPQLQKDLQSLFLGEEIELPKYDFATGTNNPSGKRLKLTDKMVVIMEGIHGLNPELTKSIPAEQKFKIFVSALTTIQLDMHNYIPTNDNRLLRRIVRDAKYRKITAESSIARWPSVMAGERKWIVPFQEEADVMFNSALLFELAGLRNQALPLLEMVGENSPQYSEARRLINFLNYIKPINTDGLPPTSLLREFLGGSTFHY